MKPQDQDKIVTVSLGSNCGDREMMIREAIGWLSGVLKEFHVSDIYETAPVGHSGENYFNAVASGKLEIPLSQFESQCKEFELSHGRDSHSRELKLVPIDLDVVTSGNSVVRPADYHQGFYQTGLRQLSEEGVLPDVVVLPFQKYGV